MGKYREREREGDGKIVGLNLLIICTDEMEKARNM